MKSGQRAWTRDELILAVNLYCKLPFGKLHRSTPEIINLAQTINRTVNSVALKLVNFASFDPSLRARGIKGASNASKLDRAVWDEFSANWDRLPFESEELLAKKKNTTVEALNDINDDDLPGRGTVREQLIRARVNQSFFRKTVLTSYNNTCCITGIQQVDLLIASHIRPWGIDENNRLNPRNGIAVNALHDRAFESGLITISQDYKIIVSPVLKKQGNNPAIDDYFLKYENRRIILPTRFLPETDFLKYHNQERFRG